MRVEMFYDVVCPYACIGAFASGAEAAALGIELVWRPVLLGGLMAAAGTPAVPAQTWSPARQAVGRHDLLREGRRAGLGIRQHPEHPRRTVEAMRLLTAAPEDVRPALSLALFRAGNLEGRDVSDRSVWGPLAQAHGVDPDVVNDPAVKDELRAATAAASDAGMFGVPTYRVGDRWWWGQDRRHLAWSAATGRRVESRQVDGGRRGAVVTVYHDVASPFSYLAQTQLPRLAAAAGAVLDWRPILVGGLFRDIGTVDVPLVAMGERKRAYQVRDLLDHAAWWDVPFTFPSRFPLRSVTVQRALLVAPEARKTLYRAVWAEDADVGSDEGCTAILDGAGLPGRDILARTQAPEVKAALIANTQAARDAGACGVPTLVIDGEVFWGQDRLAAAFEAMTAAS